MPLAPSATFAEIVCSPSWHQRLRSKRSKARARLRTGRATARDLLRLLVHHGTPCSQRAKLLQRLGDRMGKKGQGEWSGATWSQQEQPYSWGYWGGSRKGRQQKDASWEGQSGQPTASKFPSYQQVRGDETATGPWRDFGPPQAGLSPPPAPLRSPSHPRPRGSVKDAAKAPSHQPRRRHPQPELARQQQLLGKREKAECPAPAAVNALAASASRPPGAEAIATVKAVPPPFFAKGRDCRPWQCASAACGNPHPARRGLRSFGSHQDGVAEPGGVIALQHVSVFLGVLWYCRLRPAVCPVGWCPLQLPVRCPPASASLLMTAVPPCRGSLHLHSHVCLCSAPWVLEPHCHACHGGCQCWQPLSGCTTPTSSVLFALRLATFEVLGQRRFPAFLPQSSTYLKKLCAHLGAPSSMGAVL